MAVTIHEQVADVTRAMESAIYAALESIDAYTDTLTRLIGEQQTSAQPNEKLIKRFNQFLARAASMTTVIEDHVITELLFCLDRLFAVEMAERGEFI